MRPVTVLDAVEPYFDGAPTVAKAARMNDREFEELFAGLDHFYANYTPPAPRGLRVALPVMSTFSCPPTTYLNPAVLYAHECASPDLMSRWNWRRVEDLGVTELRRQFTLPLIWLERIAWLIEEQAVLPIPSDAGRWHRINFPQRDPVKELTPSEVDAVAEVRRALVRRSRRDSEEQEWDLARHRMAVEEFLAETYRGELNQLDGFDMQAVWGFQSGMADLQFSIDANARPFPLSEKDWMLFELARGDSEVTGLLDLDLRVINSLATVQLPSLGSSGKHTRSLLAARRDEPAFEEWRAGLRRAIRTVESSPPGTAFNTTTKQALEDELLPLAAEVRRATSRSAALSRAAAEGGISLSVGAGGMSGAGLLCNFDPAAAIAGLSVGALGRVAAAYLLAGQRPQGQHRFVSAFFSAVKSSDT
jgi:hypothetical protein